MFQIAYLVLIHQHYASHQPSSPPPPFIIRQGWRRLCSNGTSGGGSWGHWHCESEMRGRGVYSHGEDGIFLNFCGENVPSLPPPLNGSKVMGSRKEGKVTGGGESGGESTTTNWVPSSNKLSRVHTPRRRRRTISCPKNLHFSLPFYNLFSEILFPQNNEENILFSIFTVHSAPNFGAPKSRVFTKR